MTDGLGTLQANWWDFEKPAGAPGTHASGDDGEDLNTPDHTPVSFPVSGTILNASYHDFGGEEVLFPDPGQPIQGFDPYWIHLDQEYVQQGQHVDAGQIVGTTGGGVGDLVLHNGTVQPALDQSWYDGHSTGYHSETGAFMDTSAAGDITEFDQGWGHPARQEDPRPIIDALRASEGSGGTPGVLFGQNFSQTSGHTTNSIINFPDPSTWLRGMLGIAAIPPHIASRTAAGIAGMGLVWMGLLVAASGEVQQKAVQTLDKLGPVAAVASPAVAAAGALRGRSRVTPAPARPRPLAPARQVSGPAPAKSLPKPTPEVRETEQEAGIRRSARSFGATLAATFKRKPKSRPKAAPKPKTEEYGGDTEKQHARKMVDTAKEAFKPNPPGQRIVRTDKETPKGGAK